jgi:hypothetical protein
MNIPAAPEVRGPGKIGDCTPRIGNRNDAVEIVKQLIQETSSFHRKDYFLSHSLEALQNAIERGII